MSDFGLRGVFKGPDALLLTNSFRELYQKIAQLQSRWLPLFTKVDVGQTGGITKPPEPPSAGYLYLAHDASWQQIDTSGLALGGALPADVGSTPAAGGGPAAAASDHAHRMRKPVAASYATGVSVAVANSTPVRLNYATKSYDSHTAVTTGASWHFTVPTGRTGLYRIEAQGSLNTAGAAGEVWLATVSTDFSEVRGARIATSGTAEVYPSFARTIYLEAGWQFYMAIEQNTGFAASTVANAAANWISVTEIAGGEQISATPYTPMTVSAAPAFVSGFGTRVGPGSVLATTDASTASVSGGTAPYSYLWQYVSGTDATRDSATSAATTFTRYLAASRSPGTTYTGYFRCKVTDATGAVAYSNQVLVSTTHEYVTAL